MNKVRVAILGYGRSGSSLHANPIAHHEEKFEMVAACDIDPKRLDQAKERFGCAVYEDYHKMLATEQLDLVCVITRSDQHCEMACNCLEAGVNVLVTKPWAVDATQGQRMIDTAKRSGRKLLPWLPARWGCTYRRVRELIAQGAIGDVFLIRRAETSFSTRCDWQTEKRYGGGYLLNWGPHIVDPPILLADSPVQSVYGRMKQTINPGDTEDVFLAVVQMKNGIVVQAEYTIAVPDLPTWFIQGTRGTIVVRGQHLTMHRKTPAQPDDPTKYADMKADEAQTVEEDVAGTQYGDEIEIYAEIAAAIGEGKPYAVPPEDALALSQVFDAIRTSSEENRVVPFD